jgi:tagaturonate reductase
MPGDELAVYAETVLERFQNPFVRHQLTSIALNSISKFKTRVLPSLLEYRRRTGKLPPRLVFSLAALLAFYRGNRGDSAIPLQDEPLVLDHFAAAWRGCDGSGPALRSLVTGTLGKKAFWDTDLTEVGGLADAVFTYLASIEGQGMQEAVSQLLAPNTQ